MTKQNNNNELDNFKNEIFDKFKDFDERLKQEDANLKKEIIAFAIYLFLVLGVLVIEKFLF